MKKLQSHTVQWIFLALAVGGVLFMYEVLHFDILSEGVLLLMAAAIGLGIEFQRRALAALSSQRRWQHDQADERDHTLREIEGLIFLYASLQPELPLPSLDKATVRPDFAARLALEIMSRDNPVIVELGSGISTVISASCVRRHGSGRIVSFEHMEKFAGITREMLATRGLQQHATVHIAPLKEQTFGGRTGAWYDLPATELPGQIDILFVDGPPRTVATLARYPALPALYERLAKGAVIFLDDGKRTDEQDIAALWLKEFPGLEPVYMRTRSGVIGLRKKL